MVIKRGVFEDKLDVEIVSKSLPQNDLLRIMALDSEEDKILRATVIICLILMLSCFLI